MRPHDDRSFSGDSPPCKEIPGIQDIISVNNSFSRLNSLRNSTLLSFQSVIQNYRCLYCSIREFVAVLHHLEVLLFDYSFLELVCGMINVDAFFTKLLIIDFKWQHTYSEKETKKYIESLITMIKESSNRFKNSNLDNIEVSSAFESINADFIGKFKDFDSFSTFETDYESVFSRIQSILQPSLTIASSASESNFFEWLISVFSTIFESSREYQEFVSQLSKLSQRYFAIKELQEKITQMRSLRFNDDSIDPSAIEKSPFFLRVAKKLNQLLVYNEISQKQKEDIYIINQTNSAIYNMTKSFRSSSHQCFTEMDEHMRHLESLLKKRHAEVATMRSDLLPSVDRVFKAILIKDWASRNNDTKLSIMSIIKDICFKYINNNDVISTCRMILNEFSTFFLECEESYSEIISKMTPVSYNEVILVNLESQSVRSDHIAHLTKKEIECFQKYEIDLNKLQNSLKSIQIEDRINSLLSLITNLTNLISTYISDTNEIITISDQSDINDSISQVTSNITQQKSQLEILAQQLSSELFILYKEKEKNKSLNVKKDFLKASLPNEYEMIKDGKIAQYLTKVMCPVCKVNRRDTILLSCKHPLCSHCIQKSNGICPLCKSKFSDSDIKTFRLGN